MTKTKMPNVIIDKNSTYGKKPAPVITSQGTPEHNKDPSFTMSAHDKAEQFISKMNVIRLAKIKDDQAKIPIKKKKKGYKK